MYLSGIRDIHMYIRSYVMGITFILLSYVCIKCILLETISKKKKKRYIPKYTPNGK